MMAIVSPDILTPPVDPRRAPFVCAFDQTLHGTLEELHAHLKRFKVSRERYYRQYYPRVDPINGKPIPFKDLDQYLEQSFESKVTLKRWLAANPAEGLQWSKDWLARRKADKGLIYPPSQVELRTLCCPSMPYYNAIGATEGGYYGITRTLGYLDRYTNAPLVFAPWPDEAVVICDTREQNVINLPCKTAREALDVGDYALAQPHDLGIRIERKSLADWAGTLTDRKVARKGGRKGEGVTEDSSLQRFDRELARAEAAGLYVVMMVEDTISHAQAINKLPQTRWVKASAHYLLHNLRALLTKYPLTFQCVFLDGRVTMAKAIPRVLSLGTRVRTVDLQQAFELGSLCG